VCLLIAVHVGFVLNKVVLGQGFFSKEFGCPLSIIIPQLFNNYFRFMYLPSYLFSFIYYRCCLVLISGLGL